jgi:hypothetical protein
VQEESPIQPEGQSPIYLGDYIPRAVVDACVFPRTRDWLWPLVDAAKTGLLELLWSPSIIAEVYRLNTWLWIKRHGDDTSDRTWHELSEASHNLFERLSAVFQVIEDRPPLAPSWPATRIDKWDIPIWTAAVRGNASFVVTDNLKDGPPPDPQGTQSYKGVLFVHPKPLLTFLDQRLSIIAGRGLPSISERTSAEPHELAPLDLQIEAGIREAYQRGMGGRAS